MKSLIPVFFIVGAVMVLTGAITYITGWTYSPYLYLLGAACVALAQINLPLATTNKILKRLRIQQKFGGIVLLLSAVFMFTTHGNEWIVCLAIASVLELYTAFRIPNEENKEQ